MERPVPVADVERVGRGGGVPALAVEPFLVEEPAGLDVDPRHVGQEQVRAAKLRIGIRGGAWGGARSGLAEEGRLKPKPPRRFGGSAGGGVEVAGEVPPLDLEIGMTAVIAGEDEPVAGLRHGEAVGGRGGGNGGKPGGDEAREGGEQEQLES